MQMTHPQCIKKNPTNKEKTTPNFKKWERDFNRYFTKEDVQMANKHVKMQKCRLKP